MSWVPYGRSFSSHVLQPTWKTLCASTYVKNIQSIVLPTNAILNSIQRTFSIGVNVNKQLALHFILIILTSVFVNCVAALLSFLRQFAMIRNLLWILFVASSCFIHPFIKLFTTECRKHHLYTWHAHSPHSRVDMDILQDISTALLSEM